MSTSGGGPSAHVRPLVVHAVAPPRPGSTTFGELCSTASISLIRSKTLLGGLVAAVVLAHGRRQHLRLRRPASRGDPLARRRGRRGPRPRRHRRRGPRGRGHRGRRPTTWSPPPRRAGEDGSRIAVAFGRPLELTVDGETKTHWVTATSVGAALAELGRTYGDAELSVSRGADIDRGGASVEVVTPRP